MRRPSISSRALGGVFALTLILLAWQSETGAVGTPPNALVVTDLGDASAAVASMTARGWVVTQSTVIEVLDTSEATLTGYDVAWVPAGGSQEDLRRLVQPGGPLSLFTSLGGVLVIMGIDPDALWLDIGPDGADAEAVPAGGLRQLQFW